MQKRKTRKRMTSAQSELRKGFTIPTKARIRSALNKLSKKRLVDLILFAFGQLPKTTKIKILMRIDKAPKTKARRSKTKKRKATKRKATKKSKGRKKTRTAKQRANDKRLGRMAKARARKSRR